MGGRITIDSATLMNKGFEAIEAHHLFGVPYERIEVVVHPQSIVHSLVDLNDGATLAHLGYPDMRVPISYALHYPERADVDVPRLDLAAVGELSFEAPDLETFACLRLALEAGKAGGTAPCVLNAADEVAVAAFLEGRIGFEAIGAAIERVLEEMPAAPVTHFDDLFAGRRRGAPPHRAAGRGVGARMSWVLDLRRLLGADRPARGGPLLRRQGDRDAGRALLPLLRAEAGSIKRGETEYGIDSIPARRLREDQRHEPRGGAAARGRPPRLLPPARLEADRRDRRRARGQHRPRPGDPLLRPPDQCHPIDQRVGEILPKTPAQGALKPGDKILAVDGSRYPVSINEERIERFHDEIGRHRCAGKQVDGCLAETPVDLKVERDGQLADLGSPQVRRGEAGQTLVGFSFGIDPADVSAGEAVDRSTGLPG